MTISRKVFLTGMAAICGAVALPTIASAADVTIRLAHETRPGDPAFFAAEAFKKEVEAKSNGAIEVKVFPSAQLGNNRKLFAQIQSGAVDMTFTPLNLLSDIEPALNVTAAGYMFPSWEDMDAVLKAPEFGQKWFNTVLEKGGLRVLSAFYYGTRNLTTTDKPVRKPSDLAGLKIRAVPNPMWLANVKGLGGAPTPVAWPETYQALRQGTVDGQENPIPVLYSAKLHEVQKYLTRTNHQMSSLPFLIKESSFAKLSDEHKAIISTAAVNAAQVGTDGMIKFTASLVDELKAKGVTIIDLSEAERNEFRDSVRAVLRNEVDGKAIPAGLIDETAKFIAAR